MSTKGEAATVVNAMALSLGQEIADYDGQAGAIPPAVLHPARDRGTALAAEWQNGGAEPLDQTTAPALRQYYEQYVTAMNASRSVHAAVAADRAKAAAGKAQQVADDLEARLLPALRERQRASFRASDGAGLLQLADTIATVVDTALVLKTTAEDLAEFGHVARTSVSKAGTVMTVVSLNDHVPHVLDLLEKINKAYAVFQGARAAVSLLQGGVTGSAEGRAGVSAMATAVSVGGTLLNASAGFTLYSNLYIGPMVSAALDLIAKIEDLRSRTTNRGLIALGDLDAVNWSIEPGSNSAAGARAVFDYMLAVMNAGGSDGVPVPPQAVRKYLVQMEDQFEAAAGGKHNEMPTTGFWLWEDVDQAKIRAWMWRNRLSLWGALYGDCPLPSH